MSPAVLITVGLVGLFMSVAIDVLIVSGKHQYNLDVASTMGLVAFSLMLVVAAFECRDEHASILRLETFDNRTLNLTAIVEIVLAVLIARGGALSSLLGAADLTSTQWLFGALPALLLFVFWELGKELARRRTSSVAEVAPAVVAPATA
jgi:Ca2+-transporting ATPase